MRACILIIILVDEMLIVKTLLCILGQMTNTSLIYSLQLISGKYFEENVWNIKAA